LRTLKHAVGNARASEAELRAALAVLETSGARAAIEARVDELSRAALARVQSDVTKQGALLLAGAAEALTARRS
jgi:hypothetical protein